MLHQVSCLLHGGGGGRGIIKERTAKAVENGMEETREVLLEDDAQEHACTRASALLNTVQPLLFSWEQVLQTPSPHWTCSDAAHSSTSLGLCYARKAVETPIPGGKSSSTGI